MYVSIWRMCIMDLCVCTMCMSYVFKRESRREQNVCARVCECMDLRICTMDCVYECMDLCACIMDLYVCIMCMSCVFKRSPEVNRLFPREYVSIRVVCVCNVYANR